MASRSRAKQLTYDLAIDHANRLVAERAAEVAATAARLRDDSVPDTVPASRLTPSQFARRFVERETPPGASWGAISVEPEEPGVYEPAPIAYRPQQLKQLAPVAQEMQRSERRLELRLDILAAIERNEGSKLAAARELGISSETLYRHLHAIGWQAAPSARARSVEAAKKAAAKTAAIKKARRA